MMDKVYEDDIITIYANDHEIRKDYKAGGRITSLMYKEFKSEIAALVAEQNKSKSPEVPGGREDV